MKNEKVQKSIERIDVQRNKMIIRNAIIEYINEHTFPPSVVELEKIVKISQQTISEHIKEMDLFESDKVFYKAFTPEVIMNIKEGTKKHPASQKLWMQVVEGWSEKTTTDIKFDPKEAKKVFDSYFS